MHKGILDNGGSIFRNHLKRVNHHLFLVATGGATSELDLPLHHQPLLVIIPHD